MTALEHFSYQLVTISLRLIAEVLGLGLIREIGCWRLLVRPTPLMDEQHQATDGQQRHPSSPPRTSVHRASSLT
jgi:hypothetical protein